MERNKKLTDEEIKRIQLLKIPQIELAKMFHVSQKTIWYYKHLQSREKGNDYARKRYNRMPVERKRAIRQKWLVYQRHYRRERYNNDPEFRRKCIEASKRYQKNKKQALNI